MSDATTTRQAEEAPSKGNHPDRDHLGEIDGSMGCVEIWERMSETRDE